MRSILRRRLVLVLDLAMLCVVAAGTAAVIRSFDLPPLPGMAPVIGQAWGPWSPLPFWLVLLLLLTGLAPPYLLATGRTRKSDGLIGWVLSFTLSLVFILWATWFDGSFVYAEAGGGVVELQGAWPQRQRFRLEEFRAVNVVRNSGQDEDRRPWVCWWLEFETMKGRLRISPPDQSGAAEMAPRMSSLADLPIRWYTEYQGRNRRPATREDVLRLGP